MIMEGDIDWVPLLGLASAILGALALFFMYSAGRLGLAYRNATADRDRAEAEAEAHRARLVEVLAAIPVALVETDLQGRFVFANRAAHQLLGRRDQELLGLRFHSATWGITYPDGRVIPPELLPNARALRGQTVKGFQHVIAQPGTTRKLLVSVTAMPILNGVGEVRGSMAALVEIDSLNPAASPEAELTRRVFDAAPSVLMVVGAEGQVREANRMASDLFGLEPDALRGRPFAELVAPEHRWEAAKAFALEVVRTGEAPPAPLEEAITAGDGQRRFVRWAALPLPFGEDLDAVLMIGEDVTEQPYEETPAPDTAALAAVSERLMLSEQARERAERAAAQAEAALAAALTASEERRARAEGEGAETRRLEDIGRLTGGVAQDFNALLNVMLGALEMIGRNADSPERVRRVSEAALAAGRRGERLTRQLSAFSRGDSTDLQALDLRAVVRGLPAPIQAGAVDIQTAAEPLWARFDPVALQSALTALLENARQAQGPSGPIALRLSAARLDQGDEDLSAGDYVRLSVTDTGPGMTPEVLARAQEPFFSTRQGAGGLGLPQARGFARTVGGALRLRSRPGEGTTAELWLPRSAAPADGAADAVA